MTCLLHGAARADPARTPAACKGKIDRDFTKTLDSDAQRDFYPVVVTFTRATTDDQLSKLKLLGRAGTTVASGHLTRAQIWDLCNEKTVRSIGPQSTPKASGL